MDFLVFLEEAKKYDLETEQLLSVWEGQSKVAYLNSAVRVLELDNQSSQAAGRNVRENLHMCSSLELQRTTDEGQEKEAETTTKGPQNQIMELMKEGFSKQNKFISEQFEKLQIQSSREMLEIQSGIIKINEEHQRRLTQSDQQLQLSMTEFSSFCLKQFEKIESKLNTMDDQNDKKIDRIKDEFQDLDARMKSLLLKCTDEHRVCQQESNLTLGNQIQQLSQTVWDLREHFRTVAAGKRLGDEEMCNLKNDIIQRIQGTRLKIPSATSEVMQDVVEDRKVADTRKETMMFGSHQDDRSEETELKKCCFAQQDDAARGVADVSGGGGMENRTYQSGVWVNPGPLRSNLRDVLVHPGLLRSNQSDVLVHPGPMSLNQIDLLFQPGPLSSNQRDSLVHPGQLSSNQSDVLVKPGPMSSDQSDVLVNPGPLSSDQSDVLVNPSPLNSDQSDALFNPGPLSSDQSDVIANPGPLSSDRSDALANPGPLSSDQSDALTNTLPDQSDVLVNPGPLSSAQTQQGTVDKAEKVIPTTPIAKEEELLNPQNNTVTKQASNEATQMNNSTVKTLSATKRPSGATTINSIDSQRPTASKCMNLNMKDYPKCNARTERNNDFSPGKYKMPTALSSPRTKYSQTKKPALCGQQGGISIVQLTDLMTEPVVHNKRAHQHLINKVKLPDLNYFPEKGAEFCINGACDFVSNKSWFYTDYLYTQPKTTKVRLKIAFSDEDRIQVRLCVSRCPQEVDCRWPVYFIGAGKICNHESKKYTQLWKFELQECGRPEPGAELELNATVCLLTSWAHFKNVRYSELTTRKYESDDQFRFLWTLTAH